MICFRFSSGSSGKIEIENLDFLDDITWDTDDVLTTTELILEESSEELETCVKGIGAVDMFTSAGMGVVDAFISGKFFPGPHGLRNFSHMI